MKKIPTLFVREFSNHIVTKTLNQITPGLEWVITDKDIIATVKWDGSCCAIINGELYKRYDAKYGKPIPAGAIKCQESADPITGHLPCWIKCSRNKPENKWFIAAYNKYMIRIENCEDISNGIYDGTYEAVGKHFQSNPYNISYDILLKHGNLIVDVEMTFEGIYKWLKENNQEGLVFWKNNEPICKIKRKDFGLSWPSKD